MRKLELISVIIPFQNRLPLLLEAVQSVLCQTYANFELLLIDDGSTDDLTSLKELISTDSRIIYARQEHRGVSAARNYGISLANGEYIAFLDSDDMFAPNKLKNQLLFMKVNELDFSHTSYFRVDPCGNPLETMDTSSFSGKVFPEILSCCVIATPTVMIKREILKNRGFKDGIHLGEDVCLWIDISYSHLIGGIKEPLTKVRVGNTSAVFDRNKQFIGIFNIIEHIVKNPQYAVYGQHIQILLSAYSNLFTSNIQEVQTAPAKIAFVESAWCSELEQLKASVYYKVYDKLRNKRALRFLSKTAIKPTIRASWWVFRSAKKMFSRTIPF